MIRTPASVAPLLCCLVLLGLTVPCAAQTPPADTTLVRMLTRNAHRFTLRDGAITGDGADFLLEHAARSSFFLIGEEHGTAQIPEFVSELLPRLRALGYSAYAVETGAITTDSLVRRMRAGDGSYERFLARYPRGVAFFDWAGETSLLRTALHDDYQVWGLDQEFTGAGLHFLDWLRPLASGRSGRVTLDRYAAVAHDDARRVAAGEDSAAFLMTATPAAFDSLRAAAGARVGGASRAARMIDELQESATVYRLWAGGGATNYESNYRRIRLMKRHLTSRLRAAGYFQDGAGQSSRVVIKYGSDHLVRGYTQLHQLDLGDYAAQLASMTGSESFHLMVAALQGREEDGSTWQLAVAAPELGALAQVAGSLDDDEWVVFDLAALRSWIHRQSNEKGREAFARWVWQYDAIVIGQRLTPSPHVVP